MLKSRRRKLLLLTVPGLLLITLFVFVPLVNGMRVAFFSWNGYSKTMRFVGLKNFVDLFSDERLLRTTINTLIYGFGSCLLQNVLGLAAAMFVNRKFRGCNAMRAILYMPIMISAFIMGKIMIYIFSYDNGVFNDILALFGAEPVYWLGNSWVGVLLITLVNSWQYLGLCMLIYPGGPAEHPQLLHGGGGDRGRIPLAAFYPGHSAHADPVGDHLRGDQPDRRPETVRDGRGLDRRRPQPGIHVPGTVHPAAVL